MRNFEIDTYIDDFSVEKRLRRVKPNNEQLKVIRGDMRTCELNEEMIVLEGCENKNN